MRAADLVTHDGEVIHFQVAGVHRHLSYSLGCVRMQKDSGILVPLLVEGAYLLTKLSDWLGRRGGVNMTDVLVCYIILLLSQSRPVSLF